MSDEPDPPGIEPEDISPEGSDLLAYRVIYPPSYKIDGVPHYNTFPLFNVEEPEETFAPEYGHSAGTPSIPAYLLQDGPMDIFQLLERGNKSPADHTACKLQFCEMGTDLVRSILNAISQLSSDEDSAVSTCARDLLGKTPKAIGEDLSQRAEDLHALHALAVAFTTQLQASVEKFPEAARDLARKNLEWPVMLSTKAKKVKETRAALESMSLATKATGKGVDQKTPINAFATPLVDYVDRLRKIEILEKPGSRVRAAKLIPVPDELLGRAQALEPLGEECSEEWFEVAWEVLLHFANGEPETFASLEELGEYQLGAAEELASGSRTLNADQKSLRSGIRRRLRQAIIQMAKGQ